MGNWLAKCDLNSCFRIQMSSVSSSLLTSSDDEDVDFLADERNHVRKVNRGGIGQQLPWHENYWSIKITHVVSPNEVFAILTKNAVNKKIHSLLHENYHIFFLFIGVIFKIICLYLVLFLL